MHSIHIDTSGIFWGHQSLVTLPPELDAQVTAIADMAEDDAQALLRTFARDYAARQLTQANMLTDLLPSFEPLNLAREAGRYWRR